MLINYYPDAKATVRTNVKEGKKSSALLRFVIIVI